MDSNALLILLAVMLLACCVAPMQFMRKRRNDGATKDRGDPTPKSRE